MIKIELGLESILDSWSPRNWNEENEYARIALDSMDNVKGKKINFEDNLMDEVSA